MHFETKKRSVVKAISYRIIATLATAMIVFAFTGKWLLAFGIGSLEALSKMLLYFFHERMWQKIHFGRGEVPSFVIWITGLPASGKKELGKIIDNELTKMKLKVKRLDSMDIRPLFPDVGFSNHDVKVHLHRAGHLVSMLEKSGVCVIFSSVSPFQESRDFARGLCKNFVEVYLKSTPENCEKRDRHGNYEKARKGEYKNFPGLGGVYEEPLQSEITIDADQVSMQDAAKLVLHYLTKKYINTP